jgi:membrane-bound metal-dependent hydrolase YbcI (DUF457 family)
MAFPPAHVLVGLGCAEMVGTVVPLPRRRAWLLVGVLSVLPDVDFAFGLATGPAGAYHGTFTHSILATLVVALAVWLAAGRAWGVTAAVGYGSHLLVDLLDQKMGPTNVLLGWPFTHQHAYAITRIFPTIPYWQGDGVVRAARSLLEPAVFGMLVLQTLVGVGIFLALFLTARLLRRSGAAASQGGALGANG